MVGVAMLTAAVLGSIGLGNQLFWDDEANTAFFGRNLIELGRLTAFDGTNLLGYSYGGSLGEDLGRELRVPGLPACIAAGGMLLFGQTTFGARIMFVLAGVLSVGLCSLWLKRHLRRRFPWWLPAIILALSPAFLLYIRNCRYYSPGVLFTLLVLVFWAPGPSPPWLTRGWPAGRRRLLRYSGAIAAILLLLTTHYLNAAALLAVLPVFFLERRYRQPEQYALLGTIYAVTLVFGIWTLATANPFSADYGVADAALAGAGPPVDRFTRFYTHLWWLLRDLGTHEFFPWCLVALLPVPWVPSEWLPERIVRQRSLAVDAMIVLAAAMVYVLLVAILTPPDMAKGPFAEMRYMVPLLALGAVEGSLVVVMLWRITRPLGVVALVLLVATNFLHPGFLAERDDGTRSGWPPTLARYVYELFHDYETGNESIVALLEQLPAGTTVRVWPAHMIYPPMFYAPELHYCDQLSERKKIREDLKPRLPEYLFVERARPEVILVSAPALDQALIQLHLQLGGDSYKAVRALRPYWSYTTKPEIPLHFFAAPEPDWWKYPGMVVLLAEDSRLAGHRAMRPAPNDAAGDYRLAMAMVSAAIGLDLEERPTLAAEMRNEAVDHYVAAMRIEPDYAEQCIERGNALARRRKTDAATAHYLAVLQFQPQRADEFLGAADEFARQGTTHMAVPYYRAVLWRDRQHVPARVGLAAALSALGEWDLAVKHLAHAIELDSGSISAHLILAQTLTKMWRLDEAIAAYREALSLATDAGDSDTAGRIRQALKRLEKEKAAP